MHVLFLGLGSFLWVPLFSAYGRRPVAILAMSISMVSNLGGGFATSYGTLMTARVIQSIGVSCAYVIGSAVVVDIFTPRERGRKVGIWTLLMLAFLFFSIFFLLNHADKGNQYCRSSHRPSPRWAPGK